MTTDVDSKVQIVVADDHTILVDGVVQILSKNPNYHVVATANNGKEVIAILKRHAVDIIIMDISMPEMDGIEATQIVTDHFNPTKVLIMSMHNNQGYIQNAIKAGASGYILKNTTPEEMQEAITRVMEGGSYFSLDVSASMAKSMLGVAKEKKIIKISSKEKQLLKLLSEGYTSDEIADRMETSQYTINAYRRNLVIKFEVKNVTQLIAVAIKEGFLL